MVMLCHRYPESNGGSLVRACNRGSAGGYVRRTESWILEGKERERERVYVCVRERQREINVITHRVENISVSLCSEQAFLLKTNYNSFAKRK